MERLDELSTESSKDTKDNILKKLFISSLVVLAVLYFPHSCRNYTITRNMLRYDNDMATIEKHFSDEYGKTYILYFPFRGFAYLLDMR